MNNLFWCKISHSKSGDIHGNWSPLIHFFFHHHHHLAASAEIEFTTPFQNTLSVIAVRRSSLAMAVSLEMMSGKVSFLDRLSVDRCLHKRNDDTRSSESRAQCPANWMRLLWTRVDILGRSPYMISRVRCFFQERFNTLLRGRV